MSKTEEIKKGRPKGNKPKDHKDYGNIITPFLKDITDKFEIKREDIISLKIGNRTILPDKSLVDNLFLNEERCSKENYCELLKALSFIAKEKTKIKECESLFNSMFCDLRQRIDFKFSNNRYNYTHETMIAHLQSCRKPLDIFKIYYLFDEIIKLDYKYFSHNIHLVLECDDERDGINVLNEAIHLLSEQKDSIKPKITYQISLVLRLACISKNEINQISEEYDKKRKEETNIKKCVIDLLKHKIKLFNSEPPKTYNFLPLYNNFHLLYCIYCILETNWKIPLLTTLICLSDESSSELRQYMRENGLEYCEIDD